MAKNPYQPSETTYWLAWSSPNSLDHAIENGGETIAPLPPIDAGNNIAKCHQCQSVSGAPMRERSRPNGQDFDGARPRTISCRRGVKATRRLAMPSCPASLTAERMSTVPNTMPASHPISKLKPGDPNCWSTV